MPKISRQRSVEVVKNYPLLSHSLPGADFCTVEQHLDVSVEVDKNVVLERISEGMRDQISRTHLQCYFKLWALGRTLSSTYRVLAALR